MGTGILTTTLVAPLEGEGEGEGGEGRGRGRERGRGGGRGRGMGRRRKGRKRDGEEGEKKMKSTDTIVFNKAYDFVGISHLRWTDTRKVLSYGEEGV